MQNFWNRRPINYRLGHYLFLFLLFISIYPLQVFAQNFEPCPEKYSPRANKIYDKAIKAYRIKNYTLSIQLLNDVIDAEPEYTDAYFVLGLIYIDNSRKNLKAARENFLKVIDICPGYDVYAYYHLARIAYGSREYEKAMDYITVFLEDVDKIKSDKDYSEAVGIQEYSAFYIKILNNPVPFNPKPVPGISTSSDEYLPIISPDNEMALFTRKVKVPPRRDDLTPQVRYKEQFMYSLRKDGTFYDGEVMPFPFNRNDNEGGATLTINNKELFYTLCKYQKGSRYYNCDICYSKYNDGSWTPIESVGNNVNLPDTWESQPTVTSDGKTLYFVSDRDGGFGGYDLYESSKDEHGEWGIPKNMGSVINTSGNEKSPFIHTDSHTLYFSSEGHMGMGGYDIFYSKLDSAKNWGEPINIGYPINSFEDDVGFFVSTDGQYGYFASNKYNGVGGWDLYYFDLYEEARPEKVLFVKGQVQTEEDKSFFDTRIELKNVASKKITAVPVDSVTGEYVAAVVFRNDYIMSVKKKGFVQESKYISRIDPRYTKPIDVLIELKPIEVGMSYRLNDIYFDFNSSDLPEESKVVIAEFYEFLMENSKLKVSIEGHTDNIGNDNDNLVLSEKRARSVYNQLIEMGVPQERLFYKGFGELKPVTSNNTEDGRARNRRTEFVIIEK
ncbi:MAG: OmpA family protein [Bacteroidales bacterium]|nr:OmpA family protein [Bacteroidales bacterium]MCF8404149.1 OmpA family protein [Bacteroidales bacterium]